MLSTTLKNPSFPTPGNGFSHSVPSPFLSIPGPKLGYVLVGISTKLSVQLPPTFLSPAAAGMTPTTSVDAINRIARTVRFSVDRTIDSPPGSGPRHGFGAGAGTNES
jgi:hypothetical protein